MGTICENITLIHIKNRTQVPFFCVVFIHNYSKSNEWIFMILFMCVGPGRSWPKERVIKF